MDKATYLSAICSTIGPYRQKAIFDFLASKNWDIEVAFAQACPSYDQKLLDKLSDIIIKNNIYAITYNDSAYPSTLKSISDPPAVIFYRGDVEILSESTKNIAIIGTRKITEYGKRATDMFSRSLSNAGQNIVSGLALGVDAQAHLSCLDARGIAIAVLGSSIEDDFIYPRSNYNLAQNIIQNNGCVISEYPPGTHANQITFPSRNRIIAGISRAVVITEADIKSGSLITAKLALDSARDVYAVPGSIFSNSSRGCNYLITNGAHPCTDTEDLLERLGIKKSKPNKTNLETSNYSEIEKYILNRLSSEAQPLDVDSLLVNSNFQAQDIITAITMLELSGTIKNLGNHRFIISS